MFSVVASDFDLEKTTGKPGLVDILVVGSGPAGLSAAIHGARARLKTVVVEGRMPGGQVANTAWIENFPGRYPKVSGPSLIKDLRTQAANFGAEFVRDVVEKIDFSSWPYRVQTEQGKVFHAMTAIVATGVSPERLGIPGESQFYNKGVSHCAIADGPQYKDREVVVIGGGDTAAQEVAQLANFARKVTVFVRSNKMRAAQISQEQLEDFPNVFMKYNATVKKIFGNGFGVTGLQFADNMSGRLYNFPTNGVFLAVGNKPNTDLLDGEILLDKEGYVVSKEITQETSIPGVFVAGDIISGRLKQVATAVGSGSQAGFDAVSFLVDRVGIMKRKNFDYLVCFCRRVSYSDIVKAVKGGSRTFAQLRNKLPVGSGCGCCRQKVMEILEKELKKLHKDG